MKSKLKSRIIECPVQKRLVQVDYTTVGNWFNRKYEIKSCPAMSDWGGCDRQCQPLLSIPARSAEWQARY